MMHEHYVKILAFKLYENQAFLTKEVQFQICLI